MSQLPTETPALPELTSHAMLVPWGMFARQIGLVETLMQVPIPQKTREHLPQTKLIEFLVAILNGCAYLQDISRSAHPLDQDQVVARAWGQRKWADYSGVSRTMQASDENSVSGVEKGLETISRPFIDREVVLALRERDVLIYDGDLTGRPVSNTSTTYPDAAFGWMSDTVRLGYQAALVSMHSPTYGRLWLSVKHHPGDTVSVTQAEAMIRAAEARTGAQPQRRTELLTKQIVQHRTKLHVIETKLARAQKRLEKAQERLSQVEQECQTWTGQVAELNAQYQAQNRPERPHSRLAQSRRKLAVRERRLARRQQEFARAGRWLERCQLKAIISQAKLEALEDRLEQYTRDNQANPSPVRAIFRLDGGFGSGPNIALLIEMGYDLYCKAKDHNVVKSRRKCVTSTTSWQRVGKNAEMVAWRYQKIANCPYPLDVALERFHTGNQVRHSVLLHYGEDPVTEDLTAWFSFYNGRQTIEAGIKEGKNVFQMHHLKVRSPAGLAIQEMLAAFAANFVRWAAAWLHESCPDAPAPFNCSQPSVKKMVRVAANTSAWVFWQPQGCLVRFTELSVFSGIELKIPNSGSIQLPLPLFKNFALSPI
jgi:hypothetical protein